VIESRAIRCEDCQPWLTEFALDELAGDLRDQVASHLASGCKACNDELAEMVANFAALAGTLPLESPPPHVERDLLQRVSERRAVQPATPVRVSRRTLTRGLIVAAAVLAASLIGIAAWTIRQQAITNQRLAEQVAEFQRRLAEADKAQHFSPVPQLSFASRGVAAPATPVHGYIVTDHVARQWHVYVFNLPPLPDDRVYQLWFVADNGKLIPAASAKADDTGTVSQLIDLPSELPTIAGLAISDESTSGSSAPTGTHVFQADLP
jgi:anti-sigma-K factor RskA